MDGTRVAALIDRALSKHRPITSDEVTAVLSDDECDELYDGFSDAFRALISYGWEGPPSGGDWLGYLDFDTPNVYVALPSNEDFGRDWEIFEACDRNQPSAVRQAVMKVIAHGLEWGEGFCLGFGADFVFGSPLTIEDVADAYRQALNDAGPGGLHTWALLAAQLGEPEPSDDVGREELLQAYMDSAVPELRPDGT